jgi:hypothetical protein
MARLAPQDKNDCFKICFHDIFPSADVSFKRSVPFRIFYQNSELCSLLCVLDAQIIPLLHSPWFVTRNNIWRIHITNRLFMHFPPASYNFPLGCKCSRRQPGRAVRAWCHMPILPCKAGEVLSASVPVGSLGEPHGHDATSQFFHVKQGKSAKQESRPYVDAVQKYNP